MDDQISDWQSSSSQEEADELESLDDKQLLNFYKENQLVNRINYSDQQTIDVINNRSL